MLSRRTSKNMRRLLRLSVAESSLKNNPVIQRLHTVVPEMESLYAKSLAAQASLPRRRYIDEHAVFANNELSLRQVDAYGFDYDYTLAVYTKSVNVMIYQLALDVLIGRGKYPGGIKGMSYDPAFAIRGLHYDIHRGLLMKIDAYCQIQQGTVYRGCQPLSQSDVLGVYGGTYIPRSQIEVPNYNAQTNMRQLLDIFSLAEIGLLSNVIEYMTRHEYNYDPESLFYDVQEAVRSIHIAGDLYRGIVADPELHIHPDYQLEQYLKRLRAQHRTTFLLTNSPFHFVDSGMRYLIGEHWTSLFDFIVCNAKKPSFFSSSRPFREYDPRTNRLSWNRVEGPLLRHKVYAEGSLAAFIEKTGLSSREVLYFGDHMYADLAEPILQLGWRTVAVVPELKREITISNSEEYRTNIFWIQTLTALIDSLQDAAQQDAKGIELIKQWKRERDDIRVRLKSMFNENFGSIFRTYHNASFFTRRFNRLADVYTSNVTNMLHYSINHTFYPRRTPLQHEPQVIVPRSAYENGISVRRDALTNGDFFADE